MRATSDFTQMSPDEEEDLAIDFAAYMQAGDVIASIVAWNCTVSESSLVSDPAPTSRLIGTPALSGTQVVQTVGNLVSGVIYVMEAVVLTGLGEHLSIWSLLACAPAGEG